MALILRSFAASRCRPADMVPLNPSLLSWLSCSAIFIQDTSRRIHLALTRAFLVRWLVAVAIGDLLLAGLWAAGVIIAALMLSGTVRAQAMPRDNLTVPPSRIEVKDETGRMVRVPQP